MRVLGLLLLAALACVCSAQAAESDTFEMRGRPAAELSGSYWIGNPVSISAARGNAVYIAFWNADAQC